MRRNLLRAAAAALFTIGATAGAAEPLGGPRGHWPTEITRRPLTLSQGMVEITAPLQLNASKDQDWEPVAFNPSIAFGVTDQWTIGIRHFVGVCFNDEESGCPEFYNDVSAFTRIGFLKAYGVEFALLAALDVAPLTGDEAFGADLGVGLRFGGGNVAITFAPTLSIGLDDRDGRANRTVPIMWNFGTYDVITPLETRGNKEHLSLPATLSVQLGPILALSAGASIEGPVNPEVGDFGDFYTIPVGFAATVTPLPQLDLGASITFPNMAGQDDTRDIRQLAIFAAFRI